MYIDKGVYKKIRNPEFKSDFATPMTCSLLLLKEDAKSLSLCFEGPFLSLLNLELLNTSSLLKPLGLLVADNRLTECPLPVLGSIL